METSVNPQPGRPPEACQPAIAAEQVRGRLLAWYGEHGRDLPWRGTRDPYRVWLSEIMLQQTTVTAAIPYYQRFLTALPSLPALAAAPLDEVIRLWAGLGYYSRARNLHRAAAQVMNEFSGKVPHSVEDLMRLPGIGRSTAGAILSIAFDRPAPILDGNVRRVLVRLFAWHEDPRSHRAEKQLWQWAEALTAVDRPHDYAQAIMDLGATVCIPRKPECALCPLMEICLARQQGLASELPIKRGRRAVPIRRQATVLVRVKDRLLIAQRPPSGLLGGLCEFPTADVMDGMPPQRAVQRLLNDIGCRLTPARVGGVRHVYSHFKLELGVFALRLDALQLVVENDLRWVPLDELDKIALHGAQRKALQLYLHNDQEGWAHSAGNPSTKPMEAAEFPEPA